MKKTLILIFMINLNLQAQENLKDYFVTSSFDTIKCKINKLKGGKFNFETNNQDYKKRKLKKQSFKARKSTIKKNSKILYEFLYNIKDIYISNQNIIDNPRNIKIRTPETGYAHIYIYRPYDYGTSLQGCKVYHNDKNLVNLKGNSYYLHKVKAGEKHIYHKNHLAYKDEIIIEAENKGIYYIIGATTGVSVGISSNMGITNSGGSVIIKQDTSNISKYYLLNMKKKSNKY